MATSNQLHIKSVTLNNGLKMPEIGLVESALTMGYRHIDTARFYGNEESVGEAIVSSGVPRSEVFVTSKLRPQDFGLEHARAAIKESAARLGGYVDLMLLHCPSNDRKARHEAYRAMEEAIDSGLVRSIGVSNFGIGHIDELLKVAKVRPVCNQIELHPFLQWRDLVAHCEKLNIKPVAYSPLVKARKFDDPVIARLAATHNVTPAQILVRWSLNKNFVTLPKSVDAERQRANADVYNIRLSDDDMKALDALEADLVTGWDPIRDHKV